jgi:hypothetical protein
MGDIAGDHDTIEVVPWARADTIARINGRLIGAGLRAEVGVPDSVTRADDSGEILAMCVGTGQSAEIAAVTDRLAGYEERHRRPARHAVLRDRHGGL